MKKPTPISAEGQFDKDRYTLLAQRMIDGYAEIMEGYDPFTKDPEKLASKEHRLQATLDYALSTLQDSYRGTGSVWGEYDQRSRKNFHRITGLGS